MDFPHFPPTDHFAQNPVGRERPSALWDSCSPITAVHLLRCNLPSWIRGRRALLGDGAHAGRGAGPAGWPIPGPEATPGAQLVWGGAGGGGGVNAVGMRPRLRVEEKIRPQGRFMRPPGATSRALRPPGALVWLGISHRPRTGPGRPQWAITYFLRLKYFIRTG